MTLTSLSVKGQVVIPKELREALKLRPGIKFSVFIEGSEIILKPLEKNTARDLYGKCRKADLLSDLRKERKRERKKDAGRR